MAMRRLKRKGAFGIMLGGALLLNAPAGAFVISGAKHSPTPESESRAGLHDVVLDRDELWDRFEAKGLAPQSQQSFGAQSSSPGRGEEMRQIAQRRACQNALRAFERSGGRSQLPPFCPSPN